MKSIIQALKDGDPVLFLGIIGIAMCCGYAILGILTLMGWT